MEHSSTVSGRRVRGAPVYAYERLPGLPPVSVLRLSGRPALPRHHAHAHDFLVVVYVERGGGTMRVDDREWRLADGDVLVIAPGEVVAPGELDAPEAAEAWGAYFPADVLAPRTPGTFLSWRSHPLLFPFVGRAAGGAQRLRVPPGERAAWSARFEALARELQQRRDGYNEAALAILTLLLVDISRLAADIAGDLRLANEPLLAAVFDFIEAEYARPISLADVARAVGLTAGHLTTVVGRKTGRTVQQWITERRMAEARRLLANTDLTVEAIGTAVGYRDASYFIKSFRRSHALTPLQWRHGSRS